MAIRKRSHNPKRKRYEDEDDELDDYNEDDEEDFDDEDELDDDEDSEGLVVGWLEKAQDQIDEMQSDLDNIAQSLATGKKRRKKNPQVDIQKTIQREIQKALGKSKATGSRDNRNRRRKRVGGEDREKNKRLPFLRKR